MKISPYMDINRIEFIVTYQCSGKCAHCSVSDKLNCQNGFKSIAMQEASGVIEQICGMFPVSSVMTFGGEPLLYPDVVCGIHKTAGLHGVGARQLITNGHFSKDNTICKQVAKSLYEAGINHLMLSVDAFHQETIPFEIVYGFAKYAKEAGIPHIRLHPAWVVNEGHSNPYNAKTREILAGFEDLGIPVSKGNNIFMAGKAVDSLAQYYDKPHLDLSDSCGSMPYTEPLTSITSLTIVPNGDVMICGFVIGNVYSQSIQEIISQYNPYENEWMNAILSGGASGLLELSEAKGISVDCLQCYSVCDLCRKIQSKL